MDVIEKEGELRVLAESILHEAKARGADHAELSASLEAGLSVTVRLDELETIEHTRERGFGITVYFGQRKGSASTSDSSPDAVARTVQAACDIARYTSEDPCAGLADAELMADDLPDLDLYHPWSLQPGEAEDLARSCERVARAADGRISNSEGATVGTHQGVRVYANSHGFTGSYPYARHALSCSVIAADEAGMQRDYWYTSARRVADLETAEQVGLRAAERTVRRLGSRKLETGRYPVLFAAELSSSLIGHFLAAVSGGSLYRKSSFLLDSMGRQVFPPFVDIREFPREVTGLNSAAFDDEGVATREKAFVEGGRVASYMLGSYSARKLGMQTTANAGGARNVRVSHGDDDMEGMLARMGTGLLACELIGYGVNMVTGDYSRGCAGFWVEDGKLVYPVDEITIAANLSDMYAGLVAVGADVDRRGNIQCGSMLIDEMTVAGS